MPPREYENEFDIFLFNRPFKNYLCKFRVLLSYSIKTNTDPKWWINWILSQSSWGHGDTSMAHQMVVEVTRDDRTPRIWLICNFCHPNYLTLVPLKKQLTTFAHIENEFVYMDAIANQIYWLIRDHARWYQEQISVAKKPSSKISDCLHM